MKLITRQMKADTVAQKWFRTYAHTSYWKEGRYLIGNGLTKEETHAKLVDLGTNPNPDDVDAVIGNRSWTYCTCDDCGKSVQAVVQLGQELDYESATANICFHCLKKAVKLK